MKNSNNNIERKLPAKGKQGRQEIINRIFMRYSRAKK